MVFDRIFWHIDFKTLGMSVYGVLKSFYDLVTINDRFKILRKYFFHSLHRSIPWDFKTDFVEKWNNFLTTKPILEHVVSLNGARQYLKLCLRDNHLGVTLRALEQILLFFIKKLILNIIYYVYRKSRKKILSKRVFSTFCDTGNPKMQKQSLGPSLQSVGEFYLFFYRTNYYSVNGVW